jgi:preprotein translocase subunit SecF
MDIIKNANFNFIRWRWHAAIFSLAILLAGVGAIYARGGLPLGIDFSGGSIIILQFEQPVGEDAVRRALDVVPGDKVVQQYGGADENEILVRLPQVEEEEGASLEEGSNLVMAALRDANLGNFELIGAEMVGPVIGRELQRKGIFATVFALLGIMAYISIRFRFSFAVGAVVAALHDVFVTLAFLTMFGYELSLVVVAGILAIAGYSVNDTIVIFDRVRENLRLMRRDALDLVVNTSVNQTLGRTIITSGTTTMAVLALFIFGGPGLRSFSFTMLVGVLAGTYSTIFIASSIAIFLGRKRAAARTRAVAATAPLSANSTARGVRKPGRKRA